MRQSIILTISLITSIFLVDRGAFVLINKMENRVYQGDSVGKINYFNSIKDSVNTLILGSSRAAHHFDPDFFEKSCFNMGVDGKKIAYVTALVSTLKKANQNIIVQIDHDLLFDSSYKGEDALSLLHKSFENKNLSIFFKENYQKQFLISRFLKCYTYNGKFLGTSYRFVFDDGKRRSTGYEPLFPTKSQKEIFQKILVRSDSSDFYYNIKKPLSVNKKTEEFIDIIQAKSKELGSNLIFVTSPSLKKVDEETKVQTAQFFKEKGLFYLDDSEFFKEENLEYWKDFTHLSEKGASLYSKSLSRRINNINFHALIN